MNENTKNEMMKELIEDKAGELSRPEIQNPAVEGPRRKRIALVAHDNKKPDLLEWACYNRELLIQHNLYATGTTGHLLSQELDAPVTCLQSGPLGGDQQIGHASPKARSTCSFSSGTRWSSSPTIRTSKPCCASQSCGISRWPVTALPPTTLSPRR